MPEGRASADSAWGARPWAARLLRALVFAFPFAMSVGFVWLVSRLLHPPVSTPGYVLWWLALSAAGSAVLFAADRVARRMLPLVALLRLSLVFPDQAPSRFRAALEAGRVTRLEHRLELMQQASHASTAGESAERLLTLVAALSEHDRLTRGHSERVRGYAVMIGQELRLSEAEIDQLNWAALLHDVGKLEVSGEILNKPGRPTDEEWAQLKQHPLFGENLVAPLRDWLGDWTDAVGYHHERWDGKGYPRGIAGEQIPLAGRIVAIADVFDVITSARSYKDAGSPVAGREEIARCAGSQFDPHVVRSFLNVSLGRMRLVMGPLSWLSHTPILGRLPLAPMASTAWSALGVLVAAIATGVSGAPAAHQTQVAPSASVAVVRPLPVPTPRAGAARPAATTPPRAAREAVAATSPQVAPSAAAPGTETDQAPTLAPPPSAPDGRDAPGPSESGTDGEAGSNGEPGSDAPDLAPPLPRVNHAPTFTPGAAQTVLEDTGPTTDAGWASAVDAGSGDVGQSVSFSVSSDNLGLFSSGPVVTPDGTLNYTPAPNANGFATVTVRARDDGGTANGGVDTSPAQTFTITVTPVNDIPSFAAGPNQTASEDAGPQLVANWASAVSSGPADEGGQIVSFSVSSDDPALFSAQPAVAQDGSLSYTPAANANGAATVTVLPVDDGGTTNGGNDAGAPRTFAITVGPVNDAPSFAAGPDQVIEDAGSRSVANWATAITTGPADESGQGVSFSVSNDNPGLFSAQPTVSPTGTLSYASAPDANGVATVTVQALDTGGTAAGGSDASAPQTFTITVTPVNDAPSFAAGANQTVLEDSGPRVVAGWASAISVGPADESAQTVSFLVSNDSPGLFSAQPAISATGTLSFTPAANANGQATVTVRIKDNGGTASGGVDTSAAQTLTITVTPVNDAPSFSVGPDQTVLVLGSQNVVGWANSISAGPANEASQTVTFSVSNDNPGLFTTQPDVSPNGTLTFNPALLALGSATVTVRIVDNGGTANGGVDTSPPQTFTITVILGI